MSSLPRSKNPIGSCKDNCTSRHTYRHTHSHDTHTPTQMNQAVNAKCLFSERLQNKSSFQLLPLLLAGTLMCAQGTYRHSYIHIHTRANTHTYTHSCKYQDMSCLLLTFAHIQPYAHTHPRTCRHLFTMVMSCSREWTSVAARPCWDQGCHANFKPMHTHTHTLSHICIRSLPRSYKTSSYHMLLDTHTNMRSKR